MSKTPRISMIKWWNTPVRCLKNRLTHWWTAQIRSTAALVLKMSVCAVRILHPESRLLTTSPLRTFVIHIILRCNYTYQILLCRIGSSFVMCSACRACPFTDLQPAIISSARPVVYFAAYKTRPTGTCMVYFHKHFINDRKINAEPRICLTDYCE